MNTDSSLFQRIGYASHGATEISKVLAQDSVDPVHANVRLTLPPPAGGPVLSDLMCAAPACAHEASFFAQPCLPTRVGLGLDSCQQLTTHNQ
jgi:hypothetical protein